jgi:hypothetical protein
MENKELSQEQKVTANKHHAKLREDFLKNQEKQIKEMYDELKYMRVRHEYLTLHSEIREFEMEIRKGVQNDERLVMSTIEQCVKIMGEEFRPQIFEGFGIPTKGQPEDPNPAIASQQEVLEPALKDDEFAIDLVEEELPVIPIGKEVE